MLFSAQPQISATGTLTFTAAPNVNGLATVTVQLHDNGGIADGGVDTSAAQTFTISVTAVNDAPSFTKGADQTSSAGAGAQTVAVWATNLSAGPADESAQALNFIVTTNNAALFSVQPVIAANGTLTYTPAATGGGTAVVTVQLHDNGGVANGGVDTSAAQTFNITLPFPMHSFLTTLVTSRVGYAFTTRMFLDTLLQYNTDLRQFSANVRFDLIHRPLSDLFVVYNEQQLTSQPVPAGRGLIVKYTHMLAF